MDTIVLIVILVVFGVGYIIFLAKGSEVLERKIIAYRKAAAKKQIERSKKNTEEQIKRGEKSAEKQLERSEKKTDVVSEETKKRLNKHLKYAAISGYVVCTVVGVIKGFSSFAENIQILGHDGFICIFGPMYLLSVGFISLFFVPLGLLGGYIGYKMGDHILVSIILGILFGIGGGIVLGNLWGFL